MLRHDLPQDVVVEILSRLPVKSLMRFNCVHKSWYALMRSHHFITKHHKFATSNNLGRSVVFKYQFKGHLCVSLLSNDTLEVSRDVDLLSLFPDKIDYLDFIYGPYSGIFFSARFIPATRESKVLMILENMYASILALELIPTPMITRWLGLWTSMVASNPNLRYTTLVLILGE